MSDLVSVLVEAEAGAAAAVDTVPLAVDLDGCLVLTDTLYESVIACLKQDPMSLFPLLLALLRGRAAFKRAVAERARLDAEWLPYNQALLEYVARQREAGRRIGLFTAADQSIADGVAEHLGFFDVARGSDGKVNLSGVRKLAAIRAAFGPTFAYVGNGSVDRPIFADAQRAILVGRVGRLRARLAPDKPVEATFAVRPPSPSEWLRAVRVQHWAKNLLVFVPLITGVQAVTLETVAQAALLFLLLGMVASATYLINDSLDLTADRQHPKKRFRALAAGRVSIPGAAFASAGLLVTSYALAAWLLPIKAAACLLGYLVLTLAYSLVLKRQPIIDVVTLAGLFTLRILAGSYIIPGPISPWLLTFSMLFFLGLAMVKRYAELDRVTRAGRSGVASRGYMSEDLALLLAAGLASGFGAIIMFTIYLINEQYPRAAYQHPGFLWVMMPVLLIWLLRVWHLTLHGRMNEDPVVFALKDRFSYGLGLIVAIVLLRAW